MISCLVMQLDYYYPLIGVLASLLCIYVSFLYFLYYQRLIYTGLGNHDKNRRFIRWAQVIMLVSSMAFIGSLVKLYDLSKTAILTPAIATSAPGSGSGLSLPGAGQPSPTSPYMLTLPPESSPTPEVVPGSGFARIGNTNGFGVNVRSEPGLKYEMVTELSDGSRVELTGEVKSADGFTWQRVRMEDGRSGWIADNFLIPEP